ESSLPVKPGAALVATTCNGEASRRRHTLHTCYFGPSPRHRIYQPSPESRRSTHPLAIAQVRPKTWTRTGQSDADKRRAINNKNYLTVAATECMSLVSDDDGL